MSGIEKLKYRQRVRRFTSTRILPSDLALIHRRQAFNSDPPGVNNQLLSGIADDCHSGRSTSPEHTELCQQVSTDSPMKTTDWFKHSISFSEKHRKVWLFLD